MMPSNELIRADRAGFALPMSILLIGFLTAAIMAAFARTGAEVRVLDNQQAQQQAFAFANAGLEEYLARGRTGAKDTTITFTGGRAVVSWDTIRIGATSQDTAVFLVRSRGVVTAGVTSGRPQATRTVAQFALKPPTKVQILSSWTSLSGLVKNGSSGVITGHDACSGAALPGVALPQSTYNQQGTGNVVFGEPQAIREMGTPSQMAGQIEIDWAGISHPTAPTLAPDIVACRPATYGYDAARGPCGTFPSASTFSNNPNYWPVIVVNGSSALPANGRGFLIVTGDLTFGGGDKWDGIIMVGGKIVDNGSGNIAGAVISGLNVLKGDPVGESSVANGTKDYIYDSCKVANAANGAGRLVAVPNAWADNWLTW
jgi:hypothetical protein